MNDQRQAVFKAYMNALNMCCQLSEQRMRARMGDAQKSDLKSLEQEYQRAVAERDSKRAEWHRVVHGE